ncbi:RIO1 family regulatory kinase/ATPase domain-containing protein [Bacillus sp. Marseille-P3661]|uniref:RIO1 family regulatory kinase/ATPase domain-containing protein n=1 Tax=Bacillus sp. Marseille-P3661 TaxID=1936234 RepID=UPI000C83B5D3|nr:RIO1 family regulatory kinase/ATPase [Bacillus sp. Marseille-P3661]
MEDIKSILAAAEKNVEKIEELFASYPFLGKGNQGFVYKISPDKCVKVYKRPEDTLTESAALKALQGATIIPKLYEVGANYIIMEYIEGRQVKQYLLSEGVITKDLTEKILLVLKEMKRLKIPRVDVRLKNMILTTSNEIKVIDHVNSFKKSNTIPVLLMNGLRKQGLLPSFLEHVKELDPESYEQWKDAAQELMDKK